MKSKISNIYFLILGLLIFGTVSVSAAILLQPDEVSFISDKTSETTVKGALDELYELTKGECPVGHICTTCGVGTYANQSTMQCITCPSGYTSVSGAGKISDCYLYTTSGKYIATANSTVETDCPVGSYCSSTKVYYGSTGGKANCPSGYTSAIGASRENQCYIQTTAGYYIKTAKTKTQTICPANSYCPSSIVYYGNTGTINTCPTGKVSEKGSSSESDCNYKTTTYTKKGENYLTGTYTCVNGVATITGCSYKNNDNESATCNGGSEGVVSTYMCTRAAENITWVTNDLHNYCNSSLSSYINRSTTGTGNGGGLPETESC